MSAPILMLITTQQAAGSPPTITNDYLWRGLNKAEIHLNPQRSSGFQQ